MTITNVTTGQITEKNDAADDDQVPAFTKRLKENTIWRLQRDLMKDYLPTVRPVFNASEPVNVVVNFILFNLIDLVSKEIL